MDSYTLGPLSRDIGSAHARVLLYAEAPRLLRESTLDTRAPQFSGKKCIYSQCQTVYIRPIFFGEKYIQRRNVYTCGMMKKTGLYIRVPEEWLERVRVEAGACGEGVSEYVRMAAEMRMGGVEVVEVGEAVKRFKKNAKSLGEPKEVEKAAEVPLEEPVPAWTAKLEARGVARGFSVLPGEAAPAAIAAVSAPRTEVGEEVGDRFAEMRAKEEAKRAAEAEMKKGLSATQLQYLKR